MRIGITCHPTAGGSGIMATELGMALAERGHEIHFVAFERPFRLDGFQPNLFSHTVDVVAYPLFRNPPTSLALATRISEVAEETGIDVWHAHYAIPNAACAILARDMLPEAKRFKLVTTLHGTDITLVGADPSFSRITKYAMENSDAVTAVSNWLRRETISTFSYSKPIHTIYNFVDPSRFPEEPADRCTLADDDEKIIMHLSNFRPVKRITDVVRVFNKVLKRVKARLIMVGEGPERLSAVGVARQLGIIDQITFLGSYENIERIIPCADLVFQPSEHESFGLTPLEAMACGVPVLGTNSGGIVEVVEHGVCGYLAEVGDIDTMALYAIEILTDTAKADEMGRHGREHALSTFSRDRIVGEYESLYDSLVNSPSTVSADS
jgi:N-acetyl-alpha-D-glucosaminyl L-malate synthase BshA